MTDTLKVLQDRRGVLRLLTGVSVGAITSAAWADTGPSLQDFAGQLFTLPQAVIYTAARVITMADNSIMSDAVAVMGDRILAVGTLAEIEQGLAGQPYRVDDTFASKIIIAGLIDQHVHPVLAALTMTLDIIAIEDWVLPAGTAKAALNAQDYSARLIAAEAAMPDAETPLITWGYHHYFHGLVRREQLDAINLTRPIMVWHRSAHEVILNTAALAAFGVTEDFVNTLTGTPREQSIYDEGHFYEQGFFAVMGKLAPVLATPERLTAGLTLTRDYLHRSGITLVCEPGGVLSKPLQDVQNAILGGPDAPLRTYYIADGKSLAALHSGDNLIAETRALESWGAGKTAFIPDQVKLFADGAIYSQLMQMTEPYTDGHTGEWIMDPPVFDPVFDTYWAADYHIHVHQNGDAALDMVLNAVERNMRRKPRYDHRTTIVHFGFARADQVERLAKLGCIVSANPYYVTALSDRYAEIGLGQERADRLVPIGEVSASGVPISFHSDMPMAPAQPLFLVWSAVTRATVSGRIAGPEQRLTVEQSLRAVTIDAAQSLRMERQVGSIEPGKLANFTILEADPFTVAPEAIKDIVVWGTVLEGVIQPILSVAPIQRASLFSPARPSPLYPLANVRAVAERGSFAGCNCCGTATSATCVVPTPVIASGMGCCSTNALGWAVAAEWAAVAT